MEPGPEPAIDVDKLSYDLESVIGVLHPLSGLDLASNVDDWLGLGRG